MAEIGHETKENDIQEGQENEDQNGQNARDRILGKDQYMGRFGQGCLGNQ